MRDLVFTTGSALLLGTFLFSGSAMSQQTQPAQVYYSVPTESAYGSAPMTRDTQRTVSYGYTDGEAMLLDTIFLRPVSLVGTVVGAAAWIVSLPFSLPSNSTGEAFDALVVTPLNYTFARPLGSVTSCRDVDPGCRYPYPW